MKTFKRIIALAIVLCTLGAMMIPGVTVTAAEVVTDYDFYSVRQDLGLGTGWCYASGNANWKTVAQAYAGTHTGGKTSNWMLDTTSAMQGKFGDKITPTNGSVTYPLYFQTTPKYDCQTRKTGMAFRVKAPATGEFTLNVSYMQGNAAKLFSDGGAYVWEAPASDYTASSYVAGSNNTILANTGSLYYLTSERSDFLNDKDPAVTFKPYNASVSGYRIENAIGTTTFAMTEGKEYIVFIYGVNDAETNAANVAGSLNSTMYLNGFSLVQIVKTSYSVTYNANFGDEPATAADNENTEVAAAAVDFTVDNVPFVRDGYKLLGWSTTADGAVEYKAGDKLTLTAEAAAVELFAVWGSTQVPTTHDFANSFNGRYFSYGAQTDLLKSLDTGYEITNFWKFYRTGDGSPVASTLNAYKHLDNQAGRGFMMYNTNKDGTYDYMALEFKAPAVKGTYTLDLSFCFKANLADAGAYILDITEGGYASFDDMPKQDSDKALALNDVDISKIEGNANMKHFAGTNSVQLDPDGRYVIVFYIQGSSTTSDTYVYANNFALVYHEPEATIGDKYTGSFAGALEVATAGDTIVLGKDVVYEGIVNLDGVTLDLNGNKLTADAVIATVTDSGNGNGLIAAGEDSILTTTGTDLAIWDNTTGFEGYRVFTYSFNAVEVSDDQDVATGVNKFIDLYQAQRVLAGPENLDENGEVIKGKGDRQFKDVADDLAELYDAKSVDWRFEYTSQTYQMSRGGVCFSWGNTSIRQYGAGYSAIRIQAPGNGKVSVNLKTASEGDDAKNAGFDMYIVKASDVEALAENYGTAYDAYLASLATIAGLATQDEKTAAATSTELGAAISGAMAANTPVITGVSNGTAYSGTFEFEEGNEYIVIFNNNGSVKNALYMYFKNISFTREEKDADARTFWSYLEFNNTDAYKLVAASDLKVGFTMDWNGDWKDFEFDAATVNAWADKVLAEPETDWGFYIRVSGFESLTESGTLTGTPYIVVKNQRVEATNKVLSYTYEAPTAE